MSLPAFPSVNPDYSVIEIPLFSTQVITYGNKIEQRIKRNSVVQKTFKLKWTLLNATDKGSIYNFFLARYGSWDVFTWVNPVDSVTYTVRFKQDTFNTEYFSYQLWNLGETEFIEVVS